MITTHKELIYAIMAGRDQELKSLTRKKVESRVKKMKIIDAKSVLRVFDIEEGPAILGYVALNLDGANLAPTLFRRSTPLQFAAKFNHAHIIDNLVAAGADLECRDINEHTPLRLAASHKAFEAVQALLRHGADVNSTLNVEGGWTALCSAIMTRRLDIVCLLLDGGASANPIGRGTSSPIHLAACAGERSIAAALVKAGANCAAKDMFGETPLQLAQRFQACAEVASYFAEIEKGLIEA